MITSELSIFKNKILQVGSIIITSENRNKLFPDEDRRNQRIVLSKDIQVEIPPKTGSGGE